MTTENAQAPAAADKPPLVFLVQSELEPRLHARTREILNSNGAKTKIPFTEGVRRALSDQISESLNYVAEKFAAAYNAQDARIAKLEAQVAALTAATDRKGE